MRKYLSIICLSIVSVLNISAQDKIITKDRDTLESKVLKITEKLTTYKLSSYMEGPEYELSNNRIEKIIYSNGEEFAFDNGSPQGQAMYNQYKNSIEFVPSDLISTRVGLAFSRFVGKNFEVKLESSLSFVPYNRSNANYFLNYGGIQLNYHPLSYRKVDYYVGARLRVGNYKTYRYSPYYYDTYYYYEPVITDKVASTLGVINGMRINFNERFALNTGFSLDILIEEGHGATEPVVGGILGVCVKF